MLVLLASGCGSTAGGGDAGADLSAPQCHLDQRTCGTADVCGASCTSGCSDHGCFEPYTCVCEGGNERCFAGVPFCLPDMARSYAVDLAGTD
jgi:hypothetical protein